MQDINPNSWGSWEPATTTSTDGTYDMYPPTYTYTENAVDTSALMLRASREEAACKGWELTEADEADATNVAVAERLRWESSARPIGAMVAQRTMET